MTDERALVLVAHGSPDPDWRRPLEQLHAQLAAQLGDRVALAYLAHPPGIPEVVAELAAIGHTEILVVAALLSPGGRHVKQDIPAAVAEARSRSPELRIELSPGALGDDPRVIDALAAATLSRLDPATR
ncbi:sirohydrochlorin cobaltochelatase [Enhygromyxa salina]|uniref:Sirohydrochlorin cobaltochelatase n=1 Tax=Enhygromyxa salina TaxID=215803 RepID=A0A2S9XS19_9BACT|nr:CbiX/SirB N-terminal domain-containing protein [Enhygromyxa salina]PRP95662.1 sirohydrochlorin cobaltochelatase [Enhygromyxa salina]